MKIAAVIIARNEEKIISKTINSILTQKLKPYRIIVVNDGSTDKTGEILDTFNSIEVVNRPIRKESYLAKKELASTINFGLKKLHVDLECEYVCILGSDMLYSKNYFYDIVSRMKKNLNLVIASGVIKNEFSVDPRGSGRIIRCDFWRKIGFYYPENYGFEGYLILKANSLGYETKSFQDIVSSTQRKTGSNYDAKKYYFYGLGFKALGYTTSYTLAKSFIFFFKKPIGSMYMLKGFFSKYDNLYEKELRDYVKKTQKYNILHFNYLRLFLNLLKSS